MIVVDGSSEAPPPPAAAEVPEAHRPGNADHGELHYADWISEPRPSALAQAIPPLFQSKYQDVARYIADHERDEFERVKAIHDYVALRVDYEVPIDHTHLPPSEPETVFQRRRAVCAGYARLFEAMMKEIGVQAVYISGDARFATDDAAGASHAWNAVEIEGRWYLVDVTWDAGVINGGRFERRYSTDFLIAPPRFFVISHFPTRPEWQLISPSLSRGEFYRQPLLFPSFIAFALKLIAPDRSQITVEGPAEVILGNPGGHSVLVEYLPKSAPLDQRKPCAVTPGAKTTAVCTLPGEGAYALFIFAALRGQVRHELVAKLEVNRGG